MFDRNDITFGSFNKSYNHSKTNNNVKNIVIKNKCVKHLIKYDNGNNEIPSIDNLTKYITDQYITLWTMMKRGDLVIVIQEDNNTIFIVDHDDTQSLDISIICNNLVIKHIKEIKNMHIIIDFPVKYFDNATVNNCFYVHHYTIDKIILPVYIDVKKLKLDKLLPKDISYVKLGKSRYIYILTIYDNTSYMFIRKCSKFAKYRDKIELNAFITRLNTNCIYPSKILYRYIKKDITTIISKENVSYDNIIYF